MAATMMDSSHPDAIITGIRRAEERILLGMPWVAGE
jgi:hypothetical protein